MPKAHISLVTCCRYLTPFLNLQQNSLPAVPALPLLPSSNHQGHVNTNTKAASSPMHCTVLSHPFCGSNAALALCYTHLGGTKTMTCHHVHVLPPAVTLLLYENMAWANSVRRLCWPHSLALSFPFDINSSSSFSFHLKCYLWTWTYHDGGSKYPSSSSGRHHSSECHPISV